MAYTGDYRYRLMEIIGTQDESMNNLSLTINRGHSFLSDVINRRQNMRVDDLEKLCKAIKIDLQYFFEKPVDGDTRCSQTYIELIYEAKKCDEVLLKSVLDMIKRNNHLMGK